MFVLALCLLRLLIYFVVFLRFCLFRCLPCSFCKHMLRFIHTIKDIHKLHVSLFITGIDFILSKINGPEKNNKRNLHHPHCSHFDINFPKLNVNRLIFTVQSVLKPTVLKHVSFRSQYIFVLPIRDDTYKHFGFFD